MGLPIATTAGGICFAFPDICKTPIGTSTVPVPYPNIGQLSEAENVSENVRVAGHEVIHEESYIKDTTGDEPGSKGGIKSAVKNGGVRFTSFSSSVRVNGKAIVRMTDSTAQNVNNVEEDDWIENAIGVVLGGEATVLCG